MIHSFQFDPGAILGVSSTASLKEIRDAYHQKSLKHHPDKGGDEWAFRLVVRAYEILSNARVVGRASAEESSFHAGAYARRPPTSPPPPPPRPEPAPRRPTWAEEFNPRSATARPAGSRPDPDSSASNVSGWGGAPRSHAGEDPAKVARIVAAELLILRFELEASIDLFTRSPEDRNLSCTLHITWPLEALADAAEALPDAAKTLRRIGDAFKGRGVRKHALTKRVELEGGRFDGWLTYPTAVMASEALEAFREAIAASGLELEKQTREMAIPRQWG